MISMMRNTSIGNVRHLWPEKAGFMLNRPQGIFCYTFLHFQNPVELLTPSGVVTTNPDACYLYPPNTPQYFISHTALVHDWIHFNEESAKIWLHSGLEYNKIYYPIPGQFISDLVWKIETESLTHGPCYEKMIESKLAELFILIARVQSKPPLPIDSEITKSFQKIRLAMLENLDEKWTIKRMADSVNVSISYFHSIYKEIYGISPMQDLIIARISKAKHLLRNSTTPISEIAAMLGYSSSYHFSHQFSQYTGESPRSYRTPPPPATHSLLQFP